MPQGVSPSPFVAKAPVLADSHDLNAAHDFNAKFLNACSVRPAAIELGTELRYPTLNISLPCQHRAFHQGLEFGQTYLRPIVITALQAIIQKIEESSPDSILLFSGRDGMAFARACEAVAPTFFKSRCAILPLSRLAVEAAILDRESDGIKFTVDPLYRRESRRAATLSFNGAFAHLSKFMQTQRVGAASEIEVFEISYKGSIQEGLQALYPTKRFNGHYLYLGGAPTRIQKNAYIHRSSSSFPSDSCPNSLAEAAGHQDTVSAFEELLEGPFSTPGILSAEAMQLTPQFHLPAGTSISPLKVGNVFSHPVERDLFRLGILTSMSSSSCDVNLNSTLWNREGFDVSAFPLFKELYQWERGAAALDQNLRDILESFVPRVAKGTCRRMHQQLIKARIEPLSSQWYDTWIQYDKLNSRERREELVRSLHNNG